MARDSVTHSTESTRERIDNEFDCSPGHLAEVFGRSAVARIRLGRPCAATARLAASYAFRARPDLRRDEGTR